MDLKNIDVRIDEEDQVSSYYAHYLLPLKILLIICSMKEILSLEDIKSALHSKELRQKVSVVRSEDQAKGLLVRGRTEKCREKSQGKFRSNLG